MRKERNSRVERFNSLGEVEQKQILREYLAVSETPGISNGNQLHPADTATTVRVQNGRTLTTCGPFIEMSCQVCGESAATGR